MSVDREQLVDIITRRVMEALRDGAGTAAGPAASAAPSATVAAPAMTPAPATPPAPPPDLHDPATCERCRAFGVPAVRDPAETRVLAEAGAARVNATLGYCANRDGLAALIDHTLLKPDATRAEIETLCREAAQFCFASVCVNPNWVPVCRELLQGSGVKVCTVVGFPLGAHAPDVKAYEARRAVEQGAEEVDMVINIGALKSRDHALVEQDIRGVVQSVGRDTIVKVILETSLLNRDEKVMGASLAKAAGADFVKTSTGFAGGGATVEDVALLRETVGPDIGIKASGGVRTQEDARAMIAAGATRIGASAGVKIVRGEAAAGKGY
jgi:deoxyribose-phosphate aldolase